MRKPVACARTGMVVVDEQIAITPYTAAGVVVDDGHMRGARRMLGHQRTEQAVGPGGLGTAVKDALGVDVLPAMHGLAGHIMGVALQEAGDGRVVLAQGGLGPFGGVDMPRNKLVVRVRRPRFGMVDEVAVQIDVVFVAAPAPGKTMRVDGVDQQHGGVLGRAAFKPALRQPGHMAARAGVALDAVGARHQDQQLAGILRADPGHVGGTRFAVRPLGRIGVAGQQARATLVHGGKEFGPCLGIGVGEVVGNAVHVCSKRRTDY